MPASTSSLLILVAAVINGIIGFFGGWFGEELSSDLSLNFDNRKSSSLGIKWYNYFWYPFVMYFILIEGFFIASYAFLGYLKLIYGDNFICKPVFLFILIVLDWVIHCSGTIKKLLINSISHQLTKNFLSIII